jgi:hypothetical protein
VYHFSQHDSPELDKKDGEDDCWYAGVLSPRDKTDDLPAENPIKVKPLEGVQLQMNFYIH